MTTPTGEAPANQWMLPRESVEWVGPIVVTLTNAAGQAIPQTNVKFAVLPQGQRPVTADWAAPVVEPGGTALGVMQSAVSASIRLGIWAQVSNTPETPVLEPSEVGWIYRS